MDGTVACATCHIPAQQFQDGTALGQGVGTTDRRTMPLAGVGYSPWLFWDGRKDSLWSQALGPRGRVIVAEGSGHDIHLERPDLVIDAIAEVVQAAR